MQTFNFMPKSFEYAPVNAYWLGQMANLAYGDPATAERTVADWGFSRFRAFTARLSVPPVDTQAFTIGSPWMIVTAFRGTEPNHFKDWLTDAKAFSVPGPGNIGRVHYGFQSALNPVYGQIKDTITRFQDNGQTIWFAGHSLGAALAALAARRLQLENDRYFPRGIYTYGQPRIGDADFAAAFDKRLQSITYRFVNNNDVVTHLPPDDLLRGKLSAAILPVALRGFRHVGQFRYFDAQGGMHEAMTWWEQARKAASGLIESTGMLKPGPLTDHFMASYLTKLRKNLNG
ncbi:MAG: lipase family protein [Blastocatellia bacterium]